MTSLSRAIRSQSQKIVKFVTFGFLIFLNCERISHLTDGQAWNYDRKTDARPFDTIQDILRCLSLVQPLLKGRNAPIWRKRDPMHMRPSRTHGLTIKLILYYSGPLLATRSRPSCVAACDWSIVGGRNARLGPLRSHLGCSPTTGTIQNLYAIR